MEEAARGRGLTVSLKAFLQRVKSDDFLKRKKADRISVIRSQGEETSFWFYGSRKGKQGVCFAGCSSFEHGVYKFKSVQDVSGHWCLCSVFYRHTRSFRRWRNLRETTKNDCEDMLG